MAIGKNIGRKRPKSDSHFRLHPILLAEDEEGVRSLASRILRENGYHVLEAVEGLQALRIAQDYAGKIDLVLTDVVMPGISGSTLVVRLRAKQPDIRALYISGYTDNAIVHHGILDANIAFLQKPFTVDGLLRKVREVLNPPSGTKA
jgi:two-component system, cell cycle sensor histidine kinase and response regulator CckA